MFFQSEHFNKSFTLSADRNILDRCTDQLFHIPDVIKRRLREIRGLAASGNVAFPTVHVLINRLCDIERAADREVVNRSAVNIVSDTDGNLVQVRKNVQLGQP